MRINIAGDFCPRDRVMALIKSGEYSSLFSDIRCVNSLVDYSIVNLESPIYQGDLSRHYIKWGSILHAEAESIKALKYSGFNCMTLANNHFYDYGEAGIINTLSILENEGIDYVGGGRNLEEASLILYKDFADGRLAVINCCENEFSIAGNKQGGANPLNPISQFYAIQEARNNADYVLVISHGGMENYQYPTPRMQDLFRFFIDCGASAVVNHHQHCYSGYEFYRNCPIVYGLGNFSFDRGIYRGVNWNEGFIVCLDFGTVTTLSTIPYIQSDATPGTILMDGEKKCMFEKRIQEINAIISKRDELEAVYQELLTNLFKQYESAFEPWGKGFRGLWKRGLLPSFISPKKWLGIADYVMCESHYDVVKTMLMNKIKEYNK